MKKKILHISCGGLGNGGVSSVIFSIVQKLYSKFDFECIVFKKRCNREKEFLRYGKLHRIQAYNDDGKRHLMELILRPFRLYLNIFKICKKEKYDVVHAHNYFDEGICLWAAKNAGVPIRIAHSHNTMSPNKKNFFIKLQEKINKLMIKRFATHRVGCSEAACRDFFGNLGYNVIFNSIDLQKYMPKKSTPNDILTFIHVGRYTYSKNQEFVIKIFYNIKKKIEKCRLLLVGFGEDKEKLVKLINELNLNEVVFLIPGDKIDISKVYDEADYMIFPSIYEGFGIVLLEAQAKRIPCFVSEAIQKEVDVGLLNYINLSESEEEWAEKILLYIKRKCKIDDEIVSEKLKKFSVSTICEQYAEIYGGNK